MPLTQERSDADVPLPVQGLVLTKAALEGPRREEGRVIQPVLTAFYSDFRPNFMKPKSTKMQK